jgi:hypothetical protein
LFYSVDLFVLFVYLFFVMKNRASKSKIGAAAEAKADKSLITPVVQSDCPPPEAFLEEAKKESKRKLLMDHVGTIKTLRDEKRFTFRAIAEWLAKKGVETDHSAVYRTYLAAIPGQYRDPETDWSEVDEPGYGDEEAK